MGNLSQSRGVRIAKCIYYARTTGLGEWVGGGSVFVDGLSRVGIEEEELAGAVRGGRGTPCPWRPARTGRANLIDSATAGGMPLTTIPLGG